MPFSRIWIVLIPSTIIVLAWLTLEERNMCTFNVAAIFFRGHPYIWRTTVRHNNVLDFIIKHFNDTQDPRRSRGLTVLDFTKKLALWLITHEFVVGHRLPYVHLASTTHHSCDRCSQAFPIFFYALLLLCIMLNTTQKRGRPGNEATWYPLFAYALYYWVKLTGHKPFYTRRHFQTNNQWPLLAGK